MIRVIIGHRGVGKSSLLERHKRYHSDRPHFDLDHEVENQTGQAISEIFSQKSESVFRQIELEVFQRLRKAYPSAVIAVGAGFDPRCIDPTDEVIFVTRDTDRDGRLFLNRPRLRADLAPLEESKFLFLNRDLPFRKRADFIYHLPEGLDYENHNSTESDTIEQMILNYSFKIDDAILTLTQRDLTQLPQRRKNFRRFELRSDLLNFDELKHCLSILLPLEESSESPPEVIFSLRDSNSQDSLLACQKFARKRPSSIKIDCEVKLLNLYYFSDANANNSPNHWAAAEIISSHAKSIQTGIAELSSNLSLRTTKPHLKLAPEINTFAELKLGFEWQQADPSNRSFFPRSNSTPTWTWFRYLGKYLQKMNFVRLHNEQLDQPSLWQWLSLPKHRPQRWGAVLGAPVYFSRSPLRHHLFFQRQHGSWLSNIALTETELTTYVDWLYELGLSCAAVTSPLKHEAFHLADAKTDRAKNSQAANTLILKKQESEKLFISADNTDALGFAAFIKPYLKADSAVAIWGGGGTLEMMKQELLVWLKANAVSKNQVGFSFFSSRTSEMKWTSWAIEKNFSNYSVLIWAAPRQPLTRHPPLEWPIELILDLNYRENSLAIEHAQLINQKNNFANKINYISGLAMFDEQAQWQQKFWSSP